MNLPDGFEQFRAALGELGVEVGRETLAIWVDRQQNGREPLPETALRHLIRWAEKVIAEQA